MEPKKSAKANLENKRGIFFQAGLILTMALTLLAFEHYSPVDIEVMDQGEQFISEDLDPTVITRYEKKKLPPPKPAIKVIPVKDDVPDGFFDPEDFFTGFDDGPYNISYIPTEEPEPDIFYRVEIMPKYNGGNDVDFWRDVNSKLRYPSMAQANNLEGSVLVNFIVDNTGKMTNIQILRSTDPVFDQEVLRVLQRIDGWTPGYQRDKAVNVSYTMTFKFKLRH